MLDSSRQQWHVLGPGTLDTHDGGVTVQLPPFDVPVDLRKLWRRVSAQQC